MDFYLKLVKLKPTKKRQIVTHGMTPPKKEKKIIKISKYGVRERFHFLNCLPSFLGYSISHLIS